MRTSSYFISLLMIPLLVSASPPRGTGIKYMMPVYNSAGDIVHHEPNDGFVAGHDGETTFIAGPTHDYASGTTPQGIIYGHKDIFKPTDKIYFPATPGTAQTMTDLFGHRGLKHVHVTEPHPESIRATGNAGHVPPQSPQAAVPGHQVGQPSRAATPEHVVRQGPPPGVPPQSPHAAVPGHQVGQPSRAPAPGQTTSGPVRSSASRHRNEPYTTRTRPRKYSKGKPIP